MIAILILMLVLIKSRQEPNKTPTPTAKLPAPELWGGGDPPLGGIQLNPPHPGGVMDEGPKTCPNSREVYLR